MNDIQIRITPDGYGSFSWEFVSNGTLVTGHDCISQNDAIREAKFIADMIYCDGWTPLQQQNHVRFIRDNRICEMHELKRDPNLEVAGVIRAMAGL